MALVEALPIEIATTNGLSRLDLDDLNRFELISSEEESLGEVDFALSGEGIYSVKSRFNTEQTYEQVKDKSFQEKENIATRNKMSGKVIVGSDSGCLKDGASASAMGEFYLSDLADDEVSSLESSSTKEDPLVGSASYQCEVSPALFPFETGDGNNIVTRSNSLDSQLNYLSFDDELSKTVEFFFPEVQDGGCTDYFTHSLRKRKKDLKEDKENHEPKKSAKVATKKLSKVPSDCQPDIDVSDAWKIRRRKVEKWLSRRHKRVFSKAGQLGRTAKGKVAQKRKRNHLGRFVKCKQS